jgi:thiamine transport system substrate-binding protein
MRRYGVAVLLMLLVLTACSGEVATVEELPVVRMMTHDSFDISEDTVRSFEEQYGVRVEILQAGDAGSMLNQAILSRDNPLADVLYGVDNTLLGRALEAEILEPFDSELLAEIPGDLVLDKTHRALPVDFGDVCLNYDRRWFKDNNRTPPDDLLDLTTPEYKGLLVVESPVTSSPGLAFLLATIGEFGEEGEYTYLDYWKDLRQNDVLVVDGWEAAYWGQFTYGSGGEGGRPIVVSYASSPPVEVHFSDEEFDEAPTGAVVGDGTCFRQIEFVGVLKGAREPRHARAWVDFVLDTEFQNDIPLSMFMFPANKGAMLPDVFARFAEVPVRPAEVPFSEIEAHRQAWLEAWTEAVLQ